MKVSAPTQNEFNEVLLWLENSPNVPENIKTILTKIVSVYSSLTYGMSRANNTLDALRKAMGLKPKSEKGSSDLNLVALDADKRKEFEELSQKKAEAFKQGREYEKSLNKLRPEALGFKQLEFDFKEPMEDLFATPVADQNKGHTNAKIEKMKEFGKEKGLRSTYDTTKRVDLRVQVTEMTYKIETVEDLATGKRVRASVANYGPSGFSLTWTAIANLVKMHVGFAIPINRIAMMLGQGAFTSGKICRVLEYTASTLLPIYLALADQLADASMLKGDDTTTKILDLNKPGENSIAERVDDYLGWSSQKANGAGLKTAINVSLLMGRTEKDPRSTIRFFRTHTGSVGNFIDQLLELRDPKLKDLTFQGDLSSTNLPRKNVDKFNITIAGCGAHARRPFWRYRDEDPDLCYFMLRGFLILSQLERRIDAKGRNAETIIKYRSRYGSMIWQALRNRCKSALSGKIEGPIPLKFGHQPRLWPTGMELNKACQYVVKNYIALTAYLHNPYLKYTNNASERALRIEKCMLNSSKFRKTRNGRAVVDILRTFSATCVAAQIEVAKYLNYVFNNPEKLQSAPETITPFQVALIFEKIKPRKTNCSI